MLHDLSRLPKSIQNLRKVKALYARVYRISERHYQVPGRLKIYDLFLDESTVRCTCEAALWGRGCYHRDATALFIKANPINTTSRSNTMPVDDLSGAIQQPRAKTEYKKTNISLGRGRHPGYFVGLGDKFEEADDCGVCKGSRMVGKDECRTCKGTGRVMKTRVPILYQLGKDIIEEEYVNFILSKPEQGKGKMKSGSTLWERFRELSGGLTEPDAIREWYAALPKPPRIGIYLTVGKNQAGDRAVPSDIELHGARRAAAPPPPPPPANDSFADDLPF